MGVVTTFFACLVCLAAGVGIGLLAEWPTLRQWKALAMRQSAILHGPDLAHTARGLVRTSFQAGDGDDAVRARVGRRS